MMNHSSSAANNNNNNQPTSLARTIEALQQQQLQLQQANGPNVAPNGDQNQQSIPLIATQAAAAMAAALAAQQLMASAAAICGIDLASLSNFAILAGQPAAQPGQQSPEQLMAAAMAASTLLSPNHLVPEDLTMANGEVASNGNSAASTPAPVSSPSSLHLYNTSSSTSTSPLNQQQLSPLIKQQHHHLQQQQHQQQQQQVQQQAAALAAARNYFGAAAAAANNNHLAGLVPNTADLLALELASQLSQQQQQQQHQHQQQQQQQVQVKVQSNNNNNNNNNSIISNNDASNHNHTNNNASSNQQINGQHHTSARHHHHHLLGGHHHHSSIQSQQQLLATRGYNPMAVLGSGQQTEILTPTHLRKAKLMFFYVRYPSSATLKECFRDVRFNKNNTAQLVKWFSNFREFYYIQMEKFARDAVADDRIQCKEDIVVDFDHELINQLNNHYNKNRHIPLPEEFRQVVEETLRHFFDAIHNKRDQEQSWKKAIYKLIARLDHEVPEHFKTEAFNEHLE